MSPPRTRPGSWQALGARAAAVLVAGLAAGLAVGQTSALGSAAPGHPELGSAAPLAISIQGNQFVNQDGQPIQLHGVNQESTEYACYYGYAYASSPLDAADAAAIASWDANAVRIPLNEDCWLGINGLPAGGLTAAGYQSAIEGYVQDLNADGIYAILDLHWSADDTAQSAGQQEMPDDHSAAFWTSVATAFESDPAVLFDLFNEPEGDDQGGSFPVSWSCWLSGGCTVPNVPDGDPTENDPPTYTAVGMQALVNAIRAAGATQPIIVGGLSYANDLSGWLANEPTDPGDPGDPQIAASFHNYTGEACDTETCWNDTIAPVAAQVPVVTGEFDEDDCPSSGDDPDNFDNTYMSWADANGVSYLAWGWVVLQQPEPCSALYLITNYSDYTPASPNGVALHDHLVALAGGTGTGTTTTSTTPTTPTTTATATTPATTSTPTSTRTTATGTTGPGTRPPTGPGPERMPLDLVLKAIRRSGRRLSLRAATARAFTGTLELAVTVKLRGAKRRRATEPARTRRLTAHPRARRGVCEFAITLPRGATLEQLVLSYPGSIAFQAARIVHRGL